MADELKLDQVIGHPEFQAMPLNEKNAFLMESVPEFSRGTPKDRSELLDSLHYGEKTTPAQTMPPSQDEGVLSGLSRAVSSPFTEAVQHPLKSIISTALDPTGIGRQAISTAQQEPGLIKRAAGDVYSEMRHPLSPNPEHRAMTMLHVGEAMMPGIGSVAARSEELSSQGKPGEALGEALPTLGTLATGLLARPVMGRIPSTARAGETFQDVMGKAKDVPIDMSKVSDSALKVKELADRGGTMPMAVNKFLRRVTAPNSPPLTYEEGRDFYSNISRLSADENMRLTPVMKKAVGQFRSDLNGALQDAAGTVGKGANYQDAMQEYSKASQMTNTLSQLKDYAWQSTKRVLPWIPVAYGMKKLSDVLKE